MIPQLGVLVGLVASLVLAIYAFQKRQLTESGTVAAMFVGMTVYAFGGWQFFLLLVSFFFSSSVLTRFKAKSKESVYEEFAKGGERDFWQVAANGVLPAAFSVFHFLYPSPQSFYAFVAVLAGATADTWATELGIISRVKPYLVTTARRVPPGTSGAVSLFGLAVSFLGGAFVGLTAWLLVKAGSAVSANAVLLQAFPVIGWGVPVLWFGVAGLVGSMADSFLGATLQKMYYCPKCGKETERQLHKCGTKTSFLKGYRLVDNDVVNFLSCLVAAATVFLIPF